MTTAVVVFDGAIDALGGGALVVDQIIRIGHVDSAAGSAFRGDFGLQHGVTAGVAVDDRDASRSLTIGDDGGGIVGGVHDVVEPDDALLALAGERDGELAVVNRSGGENGGDRHHGCGDVEMELVAVPSGGEAATVALAASVAADRQFSQHFLERLRALTFDPGQRLGWRGLAFTGTTAPTGGPGTRRRVVGGAGGAGGRGGGLGLFTRVGPRGGAGNITEDMAM